MDGILGIAIPAAKPADLMAKTSPPCSKGESEPILETFHVGIACWPCNATAIAQSLARMVKSAALNVRICFSATPVYVASIVTTVLLPRSGVQIVDLQDCL